MPKCPKCGKNEVTNVAVWHPFLEQKSPFGLGFLMADGKICCSFNEGKYETVEEAKEEIKTKTFQQWYREQYNTDY